MKKTGMLIGLLVAGAGYLYMQTTTPAVKLAAMMPGGALLYLESPDFGRLVRDWDASKIKAEWPDSDNYAAFSRSNLFLKLGEMFEQYSQAAGFQPGLKSVVNLAGTESALALYEIRNAEFLYVSRVGQSALAKTELWAVRDKFQQRQAGGAPFYVRTDPASNRTVAFAFAQGLLLVGTREDLLAQSLELLAGGSGPSVATNRWHREAVAAVGAPGELRLVMNLESLVKSTYFRSYWIQRNGSEVRRYWAGIADLKRTPAGMTESRTFLRVPDGAAGPARGSVSRLVPLVPPQAGVYKAWVIEDSAEAANRIVEKLIGRRARGVADWRLAPGAISPDVRAGSEADLETRIDEQPLPTDPGLREATTGIQDLLHANGATAVLIVQRTQPAGGPFVRMPSVVVLESGRDWDGEAARTAVGRAAGKLWTSAQLGAGWTSGTAGRHTVGRLNGLGELMAAQRGSLLFLANDTALLAAMLDRLGGQPPAGALTYAAGFRHAQERGTYERLIGMLDAGQDGPDRLFSGNLASLSRLLASVVDVHLTRSEGEQRMVESVTYKNSQ